MPFWAYEGSPVVAQNGTRYQYQPAPQPLADLEALRKLGDVVKKLSAQTQPYRLGGVASFEQRQAFAPVFRREVQDQLPIINELIQSISIPNVRDDLQTMSDRRLREIANQTFSDFPNIIAGFEYQVAGTLERLLALDGLRDDRGVLFDRLAGLSIISGRSFLSLAQSTRTVWKFPPVMPAEVEDQMSHFESVTNDLVRPHLQALLQKLEDKVQGRLPLLFPRVRLTFQAVGPLKPVGWLRTSGFKGDFEVELRIYDNFKSFGNNLRLHLPMTYVDRQLSPKTMHTLLKFIKKEGPLLLDKFYIESFGVPYSDRMTAITDSNARVKDVIDQVDACKKMLEEWLNFEDPSR
jgi:hypothetical protein